MNSYQKTLLHLCTEDAIAGIEAELALLLAARNRYSHLVGGDETDRYLIDRAFGGAIQAIYSRIELLLVEVVTHIDNVLVDGQAVIHAAAVATPARPAVISDATRKALVKLIPMAYLAREGNFWPEAIILAEKCVHGLRDEFAAFRDGHRANRL